MRPVLFSFSLPYVGVVPVYAYPFFLALGFLCGSLLAGLLARRKGGDFRLTVRVCLWCFIGGYLGARVWYFLVYNHEVKQLSQYLSFWNGGLAVQGGLVGGALGGLLACRIWRLDWLKELDCIAAGMALATVFTRMGCFFNGCCWGRLCPENFWAGVRLPDLFAPVNQFYLTHADALKADALQAGLKADAMMLPLAAHPTQLYSSLAGLIAALVLVVYLFSPIYRRGGGLGWFLILDAAGRFLIEYFRGDSEWVSALGLRLHPGQWMSLLLAGAGIVILVFAGRRHHKARCLQVGAVNSDPEQNAQVAEQVHQRGGGE